MVSEGRAIWRVGGGDGAVVVVGEEEGDGLLVGVGGVERHGVGEALDAAAAGFAMREEADAHGDDGDDGDPEEDAVGADAHWLASAVAVVVGGAGGVRRGGGWTASFQRMRALAAAWATRLLVGVVVDGVGVVGARGELEDEGGAGGGVDGADGGGAVDEGDVGAVEGVGDAAGEALRLLDPRGLQGEPRRCGELAGRGR